MFFKSYIKDCLCVDKHHDGLWHGEEDRFVYSIHPFPLTHLKITCVLYLKKKRFYLRSKYRAFISYILLSLQCVLACK